MEWKPLGEHAFNLPIGPLDGDKLLEGRLPLGYAVHDDDEGIVLKVGYGTMICGRPIHHTYWSFRGVKDTDTVAFTQWDREDEMAPGWGGPASLGFDILLGEEVFDEKAHETDWDVAWEELPAIVADIRAKLLGPPIQLKEGLQ